MFQHGIDHRYQLSGHRDARLLNIPTIKNGVNGTVILKSH